MNAAVIVACFAVFMVVNHLTTLRRDRIRARREAAQGPEPICGCGDHYSFHDRKTGHCHAVHTRPTHWNAWGEARQWEEKPCECRQYVGPQPLVSLYAPQIAADTYTPDLTKPTDTTR